VELRQATRIAVEFFKEAPQFEVVVADRAAFQTIYPLAAHAVEQVDAALTLIEAGAPYLAEANARSALQHAITAQWVLLTAKGEEKVVAEIKRQQSATLGDLQRSIALPPDLLAEINAGPQSTGPARDFWKMCERFSPDKTLYVLYRRMSDSVHPSARTLNMHLDADEERGIFGLTQKSDPEPETDLLLALTFAAFLATSAVEYVRRGQPRIAALRSLAEAHGVPLDLTGDDTMVELHREGVAECGPILKT